jgi:hypothetical protein
MIRYSRRVSNKFVQWRHRFLSRRGPLTGPFKRIRVALVSDELTRVSLESECEVKNITPWNYISLLKSWRPDFLLVESAWEGIAGSWRYKIASYPDYPERTNHALDELVGHAKELNIPTVFWNKEDDIHFDRFIQSASLFDYIFTVDSNMISAYNSMLGNTVKVGSLMFAVQSRYHKFTDLNPVLSRSNFVGSYRHGIHEGRRKMQQDLFEIAGETLGLTIFDRNSGRTSNLYRYPEFPHTKVKFVVPNSKTANIYQRYLVSLNVNTIVNSPTMFSRRLVEIIGSGGLAVSTPALGIEKLFSDYCHVVSSRDGTSELLSRLARDGLSAAEKEMKIAGAEYVAKNHTWTNRLEQICAAVL